MIHNYSCWFQPTPLKNDGVKVNGCQWLSDHPIYDMDPNSAAIWCAMDPINISPMLLAYIPAPWILWDMVFMG